MVRSDRSTRTGAAGTQRSDKLRLRHVRTARDPGVLRAAVQLGLRQSLEVVVRRAAWRRLVCDGRSLDTRTAVPRELGEPVSPPEEEREDDADEDAERERLQHVAYLPAEARADTGRMVERLYLTGALHAGRYAKQSATSRASAR
jgi:hypothetical protein